MRKNTHLLKVVMVIFLTLALMSLNNLTLYAATSSPAAPTLSYSPSTPTNGNVTVTVYYPSAAAVKQYKLGTNGAWINYTGPFIVTSNTYICAQYQNSSGVWSTAGGVNVSNIDKTPPSLPTFNPSTTLPTNQNVTVTIGYSSDSNTKQYKIGNSTSWVNYTSPVTISSNNVIYAQAADSVGNWTTISSFAVSNIDKTAPDLPSINSSNTSPTNSDVTITISYSSDSSIKKYKQKSVGIWYDYTNPITLSANDIVYANASDGAGNWTSEASYLISNIDKVAPSTPNLTESTLSPINNDVNVSISYADDANIKQYKIGTSGEWTDYSTPISVSSNTTVFAKAQDIAGNWSDEGSLIISNIDRIAPEIPTFTVSNTTPTNMDITVTINFSDDSYIKEYMLGSSGIWQDYTFPLVLNANDTICAKSADNAGNWTVEENAVISNIDKTAPTNPTIVASSSESTNQPVTVSIIYSDDSSIRQYKLGASDIWSDYSAPLVLTANNTVYAKASDIAGNWTSEVSYQVTNIDTTPPASPVFTASTTAPTSQTVILTISYSSDSAILQYKVGANGLWTTYTNPVSIISNNTIYARSLDAAGNLSTETSYTVSNIIPPITVLGYTVKNYSTDVSSYNSMTANASTINDIATATYSIDGLGTLTGAAPTDQISYAGNNNIRANLMVSNNFDSNIAKQLLESPTNRQTLRNNILACLKAYNYKGVDIDIENILGEDRSYFTTFMNELYSVLKPLGYGVSVAVPAKTYDSPNAPWNYAYDYKALAQYSDYLMLMTYDEHYPGGTPGAIASIGWVTSVVDYALTVAPKEKIVMGLAAYGYDWYGTTTKAYSINSTYSLASQYGATINFDTATKSKYFTYTANGVSHAVWFEDGDTISYKLDLVNSRYLKGIGIWRLGLENTSYWSTIKSKLNK
ncbi:MAG: glycosyl hydrolase family 18 protein [Bacillota bacterium]|nr:glycosyl hydrolase family 18 protein [Bacillota bacterium]